LNFGIRENAALEQIFHRLAAIAPDATRRAKKTLDLCLHGIRHSSWPDVAWLSGLTPDGFPVEFAFSFLGGTTVRYATELAGPETLDCDKTRLAFRLYERLTGQTVCSEMEAAIFKMQSAGPLVYGAWFGGAHGPNGDRYKIYAEVPRDGGFAALAGGLFPEKELPLAHCRSLPIMFAFQPESKVCEAYFQAGNVEPADLGRLLWQWGISHRYREAMELIEDTWGRRGIPAASVFGFSLAYTSRQEPAVVSLFGRSRVLFGSDANIRRTLLKLGERKGWDMSMYESASAPLQSRDEFPAHNGVLSWIIPSQGPLEVRIGMRPPDAELSSSPATSPSNKLQERSEDPQATDGQLGQ